MEAFTRAGITPDKKASAIPTGPWETLTEGRGAQPLVGTRTEAMKRATLSKFGSAIVGAMFLIGPMWALALHQEIFFQLSFTTGCVLVFGMLMAWYLDTIDKVFSVTLAYAAVLMVFIGVIMEQEGVGP